MHFLPFCLLVISASLIKAAPQFFDYPTESNSALHHHPTSYLTTYPIQDPYNPEADFYSVKPPTIASGIAFLLITHGFKDKNPSLEEVHGTDSEEFDFNLVFGYFDGIEETSSNSLEALIRKAQSILKPNENFNDGQLEGLLKNIGTFRVYKTYEEDKDIPPIDEEKETE